MEPRLQLESVTKRFGGAVVLDNVSFDVAPGTVLGVIGPNGSGKTTLINVLNGVHRPTKGVVRLDGRRIDGRSPHRLTSLGISRTFQNPRVFQSLTLLQNLLMVTEGFGAKRGSGALDRAHELLDFVELGEFGGDVASEVSGGQKKLLEFARALMTEPCLLLMDEPFAGIHPTIKDELMDRIRRTRDRAGIAFVVVSHEVTELVELSDRLLCLAEGRVIAWGDPAEVSSEEAVIEAYLGSSVGTTAR